jgi:MFS family permease
MRQALIGSIVILSAMDILVAFLPVYGEDRGISPEVIGLAIGMMYFGQIPSRLVLDRLIVRFGYGRVLLASMAIPAVLVPAILLPIGGVAKARSLGVDPGGQIMIHGLPNEPSREDAAYLGLDWTDGCIAVTNSDMVDLWRLTTVSMPIEIRP